MISVLSRKLLQGSKFCTQQVIQAPKKFSQTISKARPVMNLYELSPNLVGKVFIAPNATVVGDIILGNDIYIGHGTIIRGDINRISLTNNVVIGDNCVLHTAASLPSGLLADLIVDRDSVVQSGCTLYSCHLGVRCFVGYNSVIMEGAVINEGAVILPNSVVPPGRMVPALQVWGGNPIKFIRPAKQQESWVTRNLAVDINKKVDEYYQQFLPINNAYLYKPTDPNDENIRNYDIVKPEKDFLREKYNADNPTIM